MMKLSQNRNGDVHFHIKDGQEYFIDTIHYDVVMSYGQGSALLFPIKDITIMWV